MLNLHYDSVQHTEYLSLFLSILLKLEHFKNKAVQIFVTWYHFFMVYVSHLCRYFYIQISRLCFNRKNFTRISWEYFDCKQFFGYLGLLMTIFESVLYTSYSHMINLRIAIYWSRLTASREIEHFITSNITSKQQPNINLTETAGSFLLNAT